ncbi:MAG: flagellin [Pseudomonadota bacterium]|nr:flagellin [Pseudomonadota bacterium]
MTNILTNSAALKSLYHLHKSDGASAEATERLASGKRINKAGDDAAGAAIVNRMTSQISGMEVAIRNAGDAISMAQTAEGALAETSEILQRMRELGVQAANGTYSGADRVSLNAEIVQLKKELIRIGEATTFNNTKLLNGTFQDTEFELGFDESPQHSHTLTIDDVRPSQLGVWNMSSQLEKTATVSSVAAASGGAGGVITTADGHGFVAGDQVTYEAVGTGASGLPGLVPGRTYVVNTAPASNTFTLRELDDTQTITYGAAGLFTGAGAKFHLTSLLGAPSVAESTLDAPTSKASITESLTVYGHVGTETISFPEGSSSRVIAEAVNAKSGTTGVSAYAETNARLTVSPNNTSDGTGNTIISFTLQGMNATPKTISSTIKFGTGETTQVSQTDLSDLRDKINGFTGDTGISATLSFDRKTIDLTSPDGYDIVIDDFDLSQNSTTAQTVVSVDYNGTTTNMYNTASNVTTWTATAHGLQVGDMVRATELTVGSGSPTTSVIDPNVTYYVKTVADANSFVLATESATGTAVDMTSGTSAHNALYNYEFTKLEKTMNLQTLDRDGNLKGTPIKLHDQTLGSNETKKVASSARLAGQIIYSSSNVFTMATNATADAKKNQFRDSPPSATLLRISDIDVLTVTSSQRMLSAVDGALRRIDAERGDLGATMNRMEHTIDNLTNIVMNTKVAKGRKLDADMAAESVELSKSRILQQAATSMLAQANKSMQSVLELLQ